MCSTGDVIEVLRHQEFSQHLQVVTLNSLGVQSYFLGDVQANEGSQFVPHTAASCCCYFPNVGRNEQRGRSEAWLPSQLAPITLNEAVRSSV